ncbi:MAG: LiaF-related protein [Bacteroidota bacterium]|nr:LiaF-related protein [Bacteroidota bacterium]MDP4230322.1 LiaF-related protein [Bacteroidota bacterium]MDP4235683.1 LiaF-related protein [Bacteroidota bacterium]
MNIIFRETYWGALIILAGILLILRNVFKIDLPVMGIIFPIFIITIGVSLLSGFRSSGERHGKNVMFSDSEFETVTSDEHYSVVFGKGSYDLRNLKPLDKDIHVDINCAFGGVEVFINPNIPLKIKVSSAFGGGQLPDGRTVAFGERVYKTPAYRDGSPSVIVKANVAFGGVEIRERSDSTSTSN